MIIITLAAINNKMGVLSIRKNNDCEIAIWEITESLDKLNQLGACITTAGINSEKRKKEWISSRLLLKEINPKHSISYNESGSPKLNNKHNISISHSKEFVAIIISQKNVGIDIEKISEKSIKVSSKFISEDNIKNLTTEKATLIWCCKEAIFKWHEKGGIDFIADIKIYPFKKMEEGKITADFRGIPLILNYQKINNHYLVYVCSD